MIYEFALEPGFVATWHGRELARLFIEAFGSSSGRFVSRYPKSWRERVWDAFESDFGSVAKDMDRKRLEEVLKELTSRSVSRKEALWDDKHNWLQNAEKEHGRRPFRAILARENPGHSAMVTTRDDILNGSSTAWKVARSVKVSRAPGSIVKEVAPMLRCATHIHFVDPYFRPSTPRFVSQLVEFLRVIENGEPNPKIELHTCDRRRPGKGGSLDWNKFRDDCKTRLSEVMPDGIRLTVRLWTPQEGGDVFHNRFILTNIGGVHFGYGLDEGTEGSSDDISIMDDEHHLLRLSDYQGPRLAFKLVGEVTVTGLG